VQPFPKRPTIAGHFLRVLGLSIRFRFRFSFSFRLKFWVFAVIMGACPQSRDHNQSIAPSARPQTFQSTNTFSSVLTPFPFSLPAAASQTARSSPTILRHTWGSRYQTPFSSPPTEPSTAGPTSHPPGVGRLTPLEHPEPYCLCTIRCECAPLCKPKLDGQAHTLDCRFSLISTFKAEQHHGYGLQKARTSCPVILKLVPSN
jgi:hypothetical protein